MKYSFIIPVYHGENTLASLFDSINTACLKYELDFEVVFVYDCGPDKSWSVITELKKQFPELITAIRLSRNYGQHNALICGFEYAKGDFFVTMDEDLQHDPNEIISLINKQGEENYDLVYGHYPERKHNSFRNITSLLLKKSLEIGIPELHKNYSAYRLIKRDIALATTKMQNSYTFLDGYLSWITTDVTSVEVKHHERLAGLSSYTLKKLIRHSVNIFVTFSNLPIKIVTIMSLLFFLFTSSYAGAILVKKILYNDLIPGFASMIVLTGFGFSAILFGIAVLGEYIQRINLKTTKRPNYNINTVL